MNKVFMFLLFGAFVLTGSVYAQPAPPADAPAAAAPAVEAPITAKPHHVHAPEMRKALRKLHEAKEALEKASHDYAGHRVAAIGYIDQAIAEIKAGLETK